MTRRTIFVVWALVGLVLVFVVVPKVLIAVGSARIEGARCGDDDFRAGIAMLRFAGHFPWAGSSADDTIADSAFSLCMPVYTKCDALRADVEQRMTEAYQAKVHAKFEPLIAAASRDQRPTLLEQRSDELDHPPWTNESWKTEATPLEREVLCHEIAAGLAWLSEGGAGVASSCPCSGLVD